MPRNVTVAKWILHVFIRRLARNEPSPVRRTSIHAGDCPLQLRTGIAVAKKGKVDTQNTLWACASTTCPVSEKRSNDG